MSRANAVRNQYIACDTVAAAVCEKREAYPDLINGVGHVGGAMDRVSGAQSNSVEDGRGGRGGEGRERGSGVGRVRGKAWDRCMTCVAWRRASAGATASWLRR
jgi:hypothetical protein